jgi:hypothetical protein
MMPGTKDATSIAATSSIEVERRDLLRWQRKLLPFMSGFLVVLAVGFFAMSLVSAYETRSFVKSESTQTARAEIEQLLHIATVSPTTTADEVQRGLLLLEADALDKRYKQASALLVSRIWTRQLAFITGMVLAFIGSVFIIGKLSESPANVTLGGLDWKAGISSTSPGLILAFLGTVLMGIALVVQPSIEVQDRPVYFVTMGIVKTTGEANGTKAVIVPDTPDPFVVGSPPSEVRKAPAPRP